MVIILVGPQGSGKTTYANSIEGHIVSQDNDGPRHLEIYKKLLKSPQTIIIDRINHTREQRRRYIDLARAAGHQTKIVVKNLPFSECLKNMDGRVHPTIHNKETAIKALRMYFSQYEKPTSEEADFLEFLSTYDPYLMEVPKGRTIIIGDVHGCYDELMELLRKVNRTDSDTVIFCGDLIDRGPKIREVLYFAMNTPNVYSVMGNHENKLARHIANLGTSLVSKIQMGHGLQQTIDQCEINDELLGWLWSLPKIIKSGENHIIHAGMNPRYPIARQSNEFLLYARNYDPVSNTFTNEASPPWYKDFTTDGNIFFGHAVHEKAEVKHNIYAMDGGCVFGGVLRAAVIDNGITIYEVPSRQHVEEAKVSSRDQMVVEGYLNRQETDKLLLYNYTDKCTYEKYWNEVTLNSRGIILEKESNKIISLPFPKFFNLGEHEVSRLENLPNEPYECFEKMDGSFGQVYFYDGWQVATRGSFTSDQAKRATQMLKKYDLSSLSKDCTLLVEIIYPENRNMPGARLVTNYGDSEFLSLLAVNDRANGQEYTRETVEAFAKAIGMPIVAKYDLSIEDMIKMQKTLPAEKEGFVVRFQSGLRVKIKGDEYMKLHKILNSITPLFIWSLMNESVSFEVPQKYLISIPEEYLPEVVEIIKKLKIRHADIVSEIGQEYVHCIEKTNIATLPVDSHESKKRLGMYIQSTPLKHSPVMFPRHFGQWKDIDRYARRACRPKMNQL